MPWHWSMTRLLTPIPSVKRGRLSPAKGSLQRLLHKHQVVLSPLRRVPKEIIAEIMKSCVQEDASCPIHQPQTVFILAGVCSRWRETAISTPQLWTYIRWRGSRSDLPITELMLSRSGHCNLRVKIFYWLTPSQQAALMNAIQPHINRIRDLHDYGGFLFNAIDDQPSFRRLRTLKCEERTPSNALITIFQHCPALEDVEICVNNGFESNRPKHVTLAHLRRLELSCSTELIDFWDLLTSPNLLEVSIFETNHRSLYPPRVTFIEYLHRSKQHLRKFRFGCSSICFGDIVEIIQAVPHLEELLISRSWAA